MFSGKLSGDTFRTSFCVTHIEPSGDLRDAVKVYDRKAKKVSSAKGVKGGELVWNVQLSVKDAATLSNPD